MKSFRGSFLAIALLVGAGFGCCTRPAEAKNFERDILETIKEKPLKVMVENKPVAYGDPALKKAIEKLSAIPRPWTVPQFIQFFQQESSAYLEKLHRLVLENKHEMWATSDEDSARCGYFARVLAASRDPRAALALGKTLDVADFPGRIEVYSSLFDYFVEDMDYGLPPEKRHSIFFGNLYDVTFPAVQRWWNTKKATLETQAGARQ